MKTTKKTTAPLFFKNKDGNNFYKVSEIDNRSMLSTFKDGANLFTEKVNLAWTTPHYVETCLESAMNEDNVPITEPEWKDALEKVFRHIHGQLI